MKYWITENLKNGKKQVSHYNNSYKCIRVIVYSVPQKKRIRKRLFYSNTLFLETKFSPSQRIYLTSKHFDGAQCLLVGVVLLWGCTKIYELLFVVPPSMWLEYSECHSFEIKNISMYLVLIFFLFSDAKWFVKADFWNLTKLYQLFSNIFNSNYVS